MMRWVLAGAWAGLIFALSSLPVIPGLPGIPGIDKAGHAFLFAALAWLAARALSPSIPRRQGHLRWPLAVLLAYLYGITDEMHQAFVPGRSCDFWDSCANLAGALLAMAAFSGKRLSRYGR